MIQVYIIVTCVVLCSCLSICYPVGQIVSRLWCIAGYLLYSIIVRISKLSSDRNFIVDDISGMSLTISYYYEPFLGSIASRCVLFHKGRFVDFFVCFGALRLEV